MRLIVVVFVILGVSNINSGDGFKFIRKSSIKGRLLTPKEGCGLTKVTTTKIVGGSVAKEGAWPWVAAIGYKAADGYRFKCGGSLLTSRHVLTAGHCTAKREVSFVRLGAHDRFASGPGPHRDVKVIHIENHLDYKTMTGSDIAILYLERDVEFTDRIRPICLPVDKAIRSQSFVGSNPFAAGWGRTSENDKQGSDLLKQLQVQVHENRICKQFYVKAGNNDADFSERVVCAGNLAGGDGICMGDSGGPLMLPVHQKDGTFPFYQIGVASFSMDCERKNSPAGYVSTQYHADWIQRTINKKIK